MDRINVVITVPLTFPEKITEERKRLIADLFRSLDFKLRVSLGADGEVNVDGLTVGKRGL